MSTPDSPPPAKRQRTESESDPSVSVNSPTRSKIWMPYGDIILQAESTQFRVNRDILAKSSSVFRDMFSLPQPPGGETVEGCLIVELSDSSKDVELLLTALYDPYHHKTKQPFDVVACMLRLGRKYDIASLKLDASSRIHRGFPSTLAAFDKSYSFAKPTARYGAIEPVPGFLVDLLKLAYENGLYTSIPPLALLCLAKHNLETLFSGVKRDDGSRIILPDDIKLTLALALERIQLFQMKNLDWLTHNEIIPNRSCVDSDCSLVRDVMYMSNIEYDRYHDDDSSEARLDVTHLIHPYLEVKGGRWHDVLCACCEKAAKAEYNASRIKAWEKLPTFFGLPDWKDLTDTY
ncbi:hypothetical protein DFH09DRAFT_1056034 [Mycena vulgaris]|nr:hypothetical protein DFH09DRAFT_1056034 [Mycena vulgaris]